MSEPSSCPVASQSITEVKRIVDLVDIDWYTGIGDDVSDNEGGKDREEKDPSLRYWDRQMQCWDTNRRGKRERKELMEERRREEVMERIKQD